MTDLALGKISQLAHHPHLRRQVQIHPEGSWTARFCRPRGLEYCQARHSGTISVGFFYVGKITNLCDANVKREQVNSIEDALRNLSHPQHVQVSSVTKGGATVDATQQILVETLPPILVLHLKRFHYDTSANGVVKIGKQVTFGPELEIPSGAKFHYEARNIDSYFGAEALSSGHRSAQLTRYKLFAGMCFFPLSLWRLS